MLQSAFRVALYNPRPVFIFSLGQVPLFYRNGLPCSPKYVNLTDKGTVCTERHALFYISSKHTEMRTPELQVYIMILTLLISENHELRNRI
jgi:hypothetical protein